jgi:hypothetical protein
MGSSAMTAAALSQTSLAGGPSDCCVMQTWTQFAPVDAFVVRQTTASNALTRYSAFYSTKGATNILGETRDGDAIPVGDPQRF